MSADVVLVVVVGGVVVGVVVVGVGVVEVVVVFVPVKLTGSPLAADSQRAMWPLVDTPCSSNSASVVVGG